VHLIPYMRRMTRRDGKPFAPFVRKELRHLSMLPAAQRLRNSEDFRIVYKRGRSYVSEYAVLIVLRRPYDSLAPPTRRIGIVVSKKQGGAVVRNRIKRRLREAVRLTVPLLLEGPYDMIWVGRGRLKAAAWPEVRAVVVELLRRARLVGRTQSGDVSGAYLGDTHEAHRAETDDNPGPCGTG